MTSQNFITRCIIAFIGVSFFVYPCFSFAQSSASSSPDTTTLIRQLQELVSSLQKQILDLQIQLEAAKGEIAEVKTEIKELKLSRSVSIGAKGDDIRELQEFLKQDPEIYPEGLVTGFFGSATEAAIKRFQEKHGIESIGVVGPKTRAKIQELFTEGAGKSDKVPPGLLHAPGIQKKLGTITEEGATTPPQVSTLTPAGTIPAQPIGQTGTTTVPAIPAVYAIMATTTATSTTNASPPAPSTGTSTAITTPIPSPTPSPTPSPSPSASPSPSTTPSPTPPSSTATTSVPYDFALANDGPKSVTQGSSVTATISSTIISGNYDSTYSVSFTAASTPGFSMYFYPASCTVPCSSALTIPTSATTTPGIYSVTITATRGSVSRTTTVTVTVTSSAATSSPSPAPPPTTATELPAPTYIRGDWSFGWSDIKNNTLAQKVLFQYSSGSSVKATKFRLYQKRPSDTSFSLAAEFSGFDTTSCTGNASAIYSGEWYLKGPPWGSCQYWFMDRNTMSAASYSFGEYNYYVVAVDASGNEGDASPTVRFVFHQPVVITSPTAAQTTSLTPTFQWTRGSDWASNFQTQIALFDSLTAINPSWAPLFTTDTSKAYDGPALDSSKQYRVSVYGRSANPSQYIDSFALPSAVVDFRVATSSAMGMPLRNLAFVLESLSKALSQLKQLLLQY